MKQLTLVTFLLFLTACDGTLQDHWAAFTREPEWLKKERASNTRITNNERTRPTADINKQKPSGTPAQAGKGPEARTGTVKASTDDKNVLLHLASITPLPSQPETTDEKAQTVVLEEYDAATGERCRNYAYYPTPVEAGEIRTACREPDTEEWIALRPLTHKTLSPLAERPPVGTAMIQESK